MNGPRRGLSNALGGELSEPAAVAVAAAAETCRLAGFGDRAEIDDDLLEWDYGDADGLRTDDIRVRIPGWSVWTHCIEGGETIEQVGGRADNVIARIDGVAGLVIAFAHAHVLRVLAARWCGLAPVEGRD